MSDDPQPYELTYDEIVELIVDVSTGVLPKTSSRQRRLVAALRELQDRRIQERVDHNLNLAEAEV